MGCAHLGDYEGFCCKDDIEDLAKEIGLGPSLYLITTWKLTCFFFIVSLLNVPVYMFLWYSDGGSVHATIGDNLAKLSLGSIGTSTTGCNYMNYASSPTFKIQCKNKFSKLQEIDYLGISKNDNTTCPILLKTPLEEMKNSFHDGCMY